MKRVRTFTLGVMVLMTSACRHPPSPNTAAISDGSGPVSAGASIRGRVSGVSDLAGNFVLNNLPRGDFDLRVTRIGYEPWMTHARVRRSGNQTYSVTLKKSVSACPRVMPGTKPIDCR